MDRPQDRLRLYFTITGDWDPSEISRQLATEPSHSWKTGDQKPRGNGRYEFSRWSLDSGMPDTATFDDQLRALLDRLRPMKDKVAMLAPANHAALVLAAEYTDWTPGIAIDAAQIQELAELGLRIDFDLYFVESAEDA